MGILDAHRKKSIRVGEFGGTPRRSGLSSGIDYGASHCQGYAHRWELNVLTICVEDSYTDNDQNIDLVRIQSRT